MKDMVTNHKELLGHIAKTFHHLLKNLKCGRRHKEFYPSRKFSKLSPTIDVNNDVYIKCRAVHQRCSGWTMWFFKVEIRSDVVAALQADLKELHQLASKNAELENEKAELTEVCRELESENDDLNEFFEKVNEALLPLFQSWINDHHEDIGLDTIWARDAMSHSEDWEGKFAIFKRVK